MTISWVNSEGKEGIAENDYEFAMQHQEGLQRQNKGDLLEQTPQSRIDNAFDIVPPKRMFDQNNPLTWGLGEINKNIQSDMQDPGPKQRQENIQQELDSGIARTPLERQIQARRSGAADSEGVSTYDHPAADRESRMYLNEMYSKFKKQPLEGPHKNLTEQEYKDLLWDTPIASSKGGGSSAADIQEMLDVTDEEHKAHYDEAVKQLGKDNVIGGINPSGRIRMRKDSEGYQEYIKNIPDDVSVHDMGDGSVILRKKPGGTPPVVGSLQDELGDPSQIPTSTYQQFADYVHDLRVKFTGEPDKWSGKEVVGDFLDKAMSVMGAGMRIPKVTLRTGISERITSPAIKSSKGVFEGENHGIAYDKADAPQNYVDGYVTNKGRFVTREEAAGIAKGQEQVLMEARQTEELHSGELKPGYERSPAAKSAAQEAFDAKVASGKKIGAADYPHVQKEFLKAINEGVTGANELATRLRLSDAQVRAVAKATDVNLNDFRTSWNEKNTQQLKDMISEGKTYAEIAKELGVSRGAVGGKVDRLGLEIQNDQSTGAGKRNVPKIYTDELRDKIRVMYAKGKTSAEIAEEMGLNAATLRFQTAKHKLRK